MIHQAVLKSVENGEACLECDGQTFRCPESLLPAGVSIGASLWLTLSAQPVSVSAPADILNELLKNHDEKAA